MKDSLIRKLKICFGFLGFMISTHPSMSNEIFKSIEEQRQIHGVDLSNVHTGSPGTEKPIDTSTFVPLDEANSTDSETEETSEGAPSCTCWETLAFYCGKSVSCYYSDDLDTSQPSNHECSKCTRRVCIGATITSAVISTALLIGGAASYSTDCGKCCCFVDYYHGYSHPGCTPDCQTPFMSTVGAIDLATILPSTCGYGCYCCAAGCNKQQFKQKFKEGQSCLPEHRCSIRNTYNNVTSLFNWCCGPSGDIPHQS